MNSPPTVAPWAAKIGRSSPNTVVVVARQGSSCSRCDVDHRALSWSTGRWCTGCDDRGATTHTPPATIQICPSPS